MRWLTTLSSRLMARRMRPLDEADTRFADLDTVPSINEDDVLLFVRERLLHAGILSSAVTIRVHRVFGSSIPPAYSKRAFTVLLDLDPAHWHSFTVAQAKSIRKAAMHSSSIHIHKIYVTPRLH